jgi:hypothetical protein
MSTLKSDPVVAIEPLAVRPRTAGRLLDCGVSKVYQLLKEGKLERVQGVDADTRITVRSIKKLVGQ